MRGIMMHVVVVAMIAMIATCVMVLSGCDSSTPPGTQGTATQAGTQSGQAATAPTIGAGDQTTDEVVLVGAANEWATVHARGPQKDVTAELIQQKDEYARVRVHSMMKVGETADWEDYRASLLFEKGKDGWQLSSASDWVSPAAQAREAENVAGGANLLKIEVVGRDEAWVIGTYQTSASMGGILFHLQNGEMRAVRSEVLLRQYTDISMPSGVEGWVVTQRYGASTTRPQLLHYIKGEWEEVEIQADVSGAGISMTSPESGWIVSSRDILHYTSGNSVEESSGNEGTGSEGVSALGTWRVLPRPKSKDQYNSGVARLHLTGDTEGWAVQGTDLLRLKDGTWSNMENPSGATLAGIDLIAAREGQAAQGWIVGSGGTIMRLEGDTWHNVDSPTKSDLAAVAAVSEQEAWAVGAEKEILHYANGTWSAADNPSGQVLNYVTVARDGSLWAVGANKTVLRLVGGVWTEYGTKP